MNRIKNFNAARFFFACMLGLVAGIFGGVIFVSVLLAVSGR